jgi:hypothetical protein
MPTRRLLIRALPLAGLTMAMMPGTGAAAPAATLRFRNQDYLHRWSRQGQHEFTPADQPDLQAWRDMVTVNQHRAVRSGEQLAELANSVLGNYQRHGKILRTNSIPRSTQKPAEHFAAAALGQPRFIEAVFARFVLREGQGQVLVVSHREYGERVGPAASAWLAQHGTAIEQALMAWDRWPSAQELERLPSHGG